MKSGLQRIAPDPRDYSLIHSYGAVASDAMSLPQDFSVYDFRPIPNQDDFDERFTPHLPPMPYGCTGETGTFDAGIQDLDLYNPKDLYDNTQPFTPNDGRDMRATLGTLKSRGPRLASGLFGKKRKAYFNVYGAGKIDDFDAARIALWINQNEKRGVWVGTFWYPEFATPRPDGTVKTPSWDTRTASLHAHLITGWKTIDGELYLEDISWQGMEYGNKGIVYFSREQYNALMKQPYTGAFTITSREGVEPVPLGFKTVIDHLVYFILDLFRISPVTPPAPTVTTIDVPPPTPIDTPVVHTDKAALLNTMCLAIQDYEGYISPNSKYPDGSRAWQNKNPGNLRRGAWTLAVGFDDKGFAIFKTYDDGFATLKAMIKNCAMGNSSIYKPSDSLLDFFHRYAPVADNNNSAAYAEFVAKRMGVDVHAWQIKSLV